MNVLLRSLSCVALLLASLPASAQVKLSGTFTAEKDCPALVSIKKGTNPDNASVSSGQAYDLLGKNKDDATHYWITVPEAKPAQRWVAVGCGSIGSADAAPPVTPPDDKSKDKTAVKPGSQLYVLALSWEPAFCEELPDKAECKAQTPQGFDATHLSLHGLWPQPRRIAYCNVSTADIDADGNHHWEDLPEPDLSPATKAALDKVMPGTQSVLERHEWTKHGTCYPGGNADQYFRDAIRMAEAVNDSPVQALFAQRIGQKVSNAEIRAAFDQAFGQGAGQRVRLSCKNDGGRQLIVEMTVGLKGDISSGTSVADLIAAAGPTDPGCPGGIVDPAGLQ